MTYNETTIACPCCSKDIKVKFKASETRAGYYTDFSCIGACSSTLPYNICEYCQYTFYDIDIIRNTKLLNKFIYSNKYKEIFKKYLFMPYYLIYHIYREQNLSLEHTLEALLYNYYDRQTLDNFKILIQSIEKFKIDDIKYEMLRGEYYTTPISQDNFL